MAAAGSGEQQTPYIGSKISLISKSEIRYEGILYTVDTKESTIALAQVKSFGTEDRATDQPFPARDEVFRFIIFKASDIKDLMVCETPKPVPQMVPGLTYDPAIVSVSQQPGGAAGGTGASPGGRGVPPSGSSSRTGTPNQQQVQSPDQQYGGRGRRSPGAQQSRQFSGRQYNNQNHNQYNNNGRQPPHAYGARGAPGAPMSYRNAAMSGVRGRGGASGPGPIGAPVNMAHQGAANAMMNQGYGRGGPMNHYHRGQFHQRHPQGGNHYRGRGRGGPGAPHEKLKFDTEFDFEKSNELFQETRGELEKELKTKLKLNESGENSDVEEGEKDVTEKDAANSENAGEEVEGDEDDSQFYDKAVSFFDNISCEALEKQEGQHRRNDWKKERETNTETFGTAALRSYNFRRGGYHRGYNRGYNNYRGGGGYYRGGRGGYHNNYRHNNNFQVANY